MPKAAKRVGLTQALGHPVREQLNVSKELIRSGLILLATVTAVYLIAKTGYNPVGFFVFAIGAIFATHNLFKIGRSPIYSVRARVAAWTFIAIAWLSFWFIDFTQIFVPAGRLA